MFGVSGLKHHSWKPSSLWPLDLSTAERPQQRSMLRIGGGISPSSFFQVRDHLDRLKGKKPQAAHVWSSNQAAKPSASVQVFTPREQRSRTGSAGNNMKMKGRLKIVGTSAATTSVTSSEEDWWEQTPNILVLETHSHHPQLKLGSYCLPFSIPCSLDSTPQFLTLFNTVWGFFHTWETDRIYFPCRAASSLLLHAEIWLLTTFFQRLDGTAVADQAAPGTIQTSSSIFYSSTKFPSHWTAKSAASMSVQEKNDNPSIQCHRFPKLPSALPAWLWGFLFLSVRSWFCQCWGGPEEPQHRPPALLVSDGCASEVHSDAQTCVSILIPRSFTWDSSSSSSFLQILLPSEAPWAGLEVRSPTAGRALNISPARQRSRPDLPSLPSERNLDDPHRDLRWRVGGRNFPSFSDLFTFLCFGFFYIITRKEKAGVKKRRRDLLSSSFPFRCSTFTCQHMIQSWWLLMNHLIWPKQTLCVFFHTQTCHKAGPRALDCPGNPTADGYRSNQLEAALDVCCWGFAGFLLLGQVPTGRAHAATEEPTPTWRRLSAPRFFQ